jgi:hypothetical protein
MSSIHTTADCADHHDVVRDYHGPAMTNPTITVLCGSTRFSHTFREQNLRLTLAGHIVLSIGCDMRTDTELFADLPPDAIADIKTSLDELHKRKIDLADEALVLNIGGYIGNSTRAEIDYAVLHGKPVRFLEPCTKTHDEHAATWKTWRDDCEVCGYSEQDVQQCAAGHPDDGVTSCGACGYGRNKVVA